MFFLLVVVAVVDVVLVIVVALVVFLLVLVLVHVLVWLQLLVLLTSPSSIICVRLVSVPNSQSAPARIPCVCFPAFRFPLQNLRMKKCCSENKRNRGSLEGIMTCIDIYRSMYTER